MDTADKDQFNNRLADWVAKQGVLFQLRYSIAGGGVNILAHHFVIIILKFLLFGAVCSLGLFFYLVKRPDTVAFQDNIRKTIVSRLACESGSMEGFNQTQNKASIRHLKLEGGKQSFFTDAEASNISLKMSLIEGFTRVWEAGTLSIDRLSLTIKAGAESPEEASQLAVSLMQDIPDFTFDSIIVKNARIQWGYSEHTSGSISGSSAIIRKVDKGWTVDFTNGTFEQNWLRKMTIKSLSLRIQPGLLTVEKAELIPEYHPSITDAEAKKGEVTFHKLKVVGSHRPTFSGSIRLKHVPLENLLLDSYLPYLSGRISGELKISGSTNTASGVELDGRMSLLQGDVISLEKRLPLLNCLSIINPAGDFGKVNFSEGYFQVKTSNGALNLTDLYLNDHTSTELRGDLQARPPTLKEIEKMLSDKLIDAEIANHISPVSIDSSKDQVLHQMNLRDANMNKSGTMQNLFEGQKTKANSPFLKESLLLEDQAIRSERIALAMIFSGKCTLAFPSAKFPAGNALFQKATLTSDKTKLEVPVPLEGRLHDLTFKLAEELLLLDESVK